jgi:hypothetical protein
VCTKDKVNYFGVIEDKQMQLSRFGKNAVKTLVADLYLAKGYKFGDGRFGVYAESFSRDYWNRRKSIQFR